MNPDLWYPLPPDMQSWNSAIMSTLAQSIPEATSYVTNITWSNMDVSTGNADALIEFLGGIASAPVTIRANRLAPIDILVTDIGAGEPKFYPLSPIFLQKIYADNVIGEPVENTTERDEDYEGPGRRIKHIKTVDSVKYASIDSVKKIVGEIEKSASVATWMANNTPELLTALYERSTEAPQETEKIAAEDIPDLIIISKDGDRFFGNGEELTGSQVGDFCKLAGATEYERTALLNGVPLVRDYREKVAAIHIPGEQELTTLAADDSFDLFTEDDMFRASRRGSVPNISISNAYLKDGTRLKGVIINVSTFTSGVADHKADSVNEPFRDFTRADVDRADGYGNLDRELFISNHGYGFATAIKSTTRLEVSGEMLAELGTPDAPAIGMVGIILENYLKDFGRVESVIRTGGKNLVRLYSYITHKPQDYTMGDTFYEVPDNQLAVANEEDITDTVTMSGVNGSVSRDNEGNIIIDGTSHSVVNCPYALMNKYACSYEDAVNITNVASNIGKCVFEVFEPVEKQADAQNDNPDKTKKDRKGTMTGSDDSDGTEQPQLQQQTPAQMMSTNNSSGAGLNTSAQLPVTSKDMENVVAINSPQTMDAMVMSNLAATNMASQDMLQRTSDSIMRAVSYLSQVIFLIRQGQLGFLKEQDVRLAIQKLTDVLTSLGLQLPQQGY